MPRRSGLLRRLSDWLFGGPELPAPVPATVIRDLQITVPPKTVTQAKPPDVVQKPVILRYELPGYRGGGTWADPEYDLAEIYKAMDTESYLRLSFDKHEELILKGRWTLTSQNPNASAFVTKRLTEISWSQNEPIEAIVEAGVEDLVETHNAFYVFARRESGNKYTSRYGREVYPITGIFSPNPSTMRPRIEDDSRKHRTITSWVQVVDGAEFRTYFPHNVVHMAFRKKRGFVFGTPSVQPTLDDILALRRIEELCEVVLHKHAFPFFHYRVGTKEEPARVRDNGTSEVDDLRAQIASMPFEGGLVTSHRHEVLVVGADNKGVNPEPLLKHYESRVLSGVNLSGVDVGRGGTANRGTAQTMSRGLSDRCTRYQNFFASRFTFHVLDELVMEGGWLPTPENRVYLVFAIIDTEEQRAQENHTLAMYQGDLITETEARLSISRDPITDEQRNDMFFEHVTKPMNIIRAVDEPFTPEAKSAAKAAKLVSAAINTTSNKEKPTNQHGTKSAKPKTPANDFGQLSLELIASGRGELLGRLDGVDKTFEKLGKLVEAHSESWLVDGCNRYLRESGSSKDLYVGKTVLSGFLQDVANSKLELLKRQLELALGRGSSADDRASILDAMLPVLELGLSSLVTMGNNYGYARTAHKDKKEFVRWSLSDCACDSCKSKVRAPIKLHKFSLADMDEHPNCMPQLEVVEDLS